MAYNKDYRKIRTLDFDAIQIGDEAQLNHVLTKEDVQAFASLTGDFNPLHLNEDFARKTNFKKPVVHGMLSASFISTMIGMLLPGCGALWMGQTISFLLPAYVGDTITLVAKVKQKSPATRIVVLDIAISNQHGKELIVGESTVKMPVLKEEEKIMEQNEKKTILITGGSGGIGSATAQKLASEGHAVVVNYAHAEAEAKRVVALITDSGGKAMAIKADIGDPNQVKELFHAAEKSFGPIEAVVHCAAPVNPPQPFDKLDWGSFQEQLDVQLKGAFNCAQCVLPNMAKAKSGDFVFIGTIYTDGAPPVQQSRYVVAKSALTSLARCLAVEYGPLGIRVNVVAPGMTETTMIASLPDKTKMLAKMQTPLRRLAEPIDIANTISFLLSPAARHITGETIRVCGGTVMA
jgi:3-oxoacyl-[acyl-carrier protein] reductase